MPTYFSFSILKIYVLHISASTITLFYYQEVALELLFYFYKKIFKTVKLTF